MQRVAGFRGHLAGSIGQGQRLLLMHMCRGELQAVYRIHHCLHIRYMVSCLNPGY